VDKEGGKNMGNFTLRQLRLAKEISQEKMAEELGVHRNTYASLEENPGKISIDQAKAIALILEVSVDAIFFGN
jgi:DNA-binding XRE family transcriptional regulator